MKIRMKARKLGNADVNFISLVERGANRAPFKIQKQESQTMIDFGFMSRKVQKSAAGGQIVAYVIQKADRKPELEKALKEAGAKVDVVVEDGDVVIYKQDDTVLKSEDGEVNKEVVAVKLTDDFAVVCKGFDPHQLTQESSFGEILKSHGFMPGFSMATEALYQSVRNSLLSSEDRSEAVKGIGEALDEYGNYVGGLAKQIPQAAFKSLEAFQKAKKEATKEPVKKEMTDEEKAFMESLDEAGKMAFMKASPEERAAMMAKSKPAAAEEKPVVEDAAMKTEDKKSEPAQKAEDKKEDVTKGANGTSAGSGQGEGAQAGKEAASAVNQGTASATSDMQAPAARVDGAGGEPSAVAPASGSVSNDGYDPKKAPREHPETVVDKAQVEKMVTDAVATATAAIAASITAQITKSMETMIGGVQKSVTEIKGSVEQATKNAKDALDLAQKTDQTLSGKVVSEDGGDPVETPVRKSEGAIGTFDTAFHRGVRKQDKARQAVRRTM